MKTFLLLLLSIWRPSDATYIVTSASRPNFASRNHYLLSYPIVQSALRLFDKDILDHEWVVRNLLGGMAGGFGLKGSYIQDSGHITITSLACAVALDIHPVFTTMVILTGWAVKTLAAHSMRLWVGENEHVAEVFLQYSIP